MKNNLFRLLFVVDKPIEKTEEFALFLALFILCINSRDFCHIGTIRFTPFGK